MEHLRGKVALVTGAGSGMGGLAARRIAERGGLVAALDVDEAGLARTAEGLAGVATFACDVSDRSGVAATVKEVEAQLGPVFRVMNAAGIARVGLLLEQDPDEVARLMAVNYGGIVNVCTAVLPGMLERQQGELVNFASLAGWIPQAKMGAYCATKFAVVAYSETLWIENRGRGVRFACVCPPAVRTPMLPDFFALPENQKRSMAIPPETVVDEIERALAKDRFWVLPHATGKLLWRLRRHTPNLLRRVVTSKRFDLITAAR